MIPGRGELIDRHDDQPLAIGREFDAFFAGANERDRVLRLARRFV